MKKKILAASVAAVMMGSTGLATAALDITDKGQLLLSPVYVGDAGHSTDITIWNTSDQQAVKAKIVFRSHCDSAEVLDFVLYLSPADVWRGSVVYDGSNARMVTSDDSSKIEADVGQGSAWNNVVPANFPFYTDKLVQRPVGGLTSNCVGQDSNDFGHFEVIGVYSAELGDYVVAAATTVTVERGMDKEDLAMIFDHADANVGPRALRADNDITDGDGAVDIYSADPTRLNIAGRVDIVSVSNGERGSFNIPAFAGTAGAEYDALGVAPVNDVDNYVMSNDQYDADTGADSFVGVDFADLAAADTVFVIGSDTVGLLQATMADFAEQWAYESDNSNATGIIATAPLRYRHIAVEHVGACTMDVGFTANQVNEYSAPFNLITGSIQYVLRTYDNSENLVTAVGGATSGGVGASPDTLPQETNYLVPNYAFPEGMAEMAWAQQNEDPCTFVGMPMLVTALRYEISGGAAVNYMMNHAVTK